MNQLSLKLSARSNNVDANVSTQKDDKVDTQKDNKDISIAAPIDVSIVAPVSTQMNNKVDIDPVGYDYYDETDKYIYDNNNNKPVVEFTENNIISKSEYEILTRLDIDIYSLFLNKYTDAHLLINYIPDTTKKNFLYEKFNLYAFRVDLCLLVLNILSNPYGNHEKNIKLLELEQAKASNEESIKNISILYGENLLNKLIKSPFSRDEFKKYFDDAIRIVSASNSIENMDNIPLINNTHLKNIYNTDTICDNNIKSKEYINLLFQDYDTMKDYIFGIFASIVVDEVKYHFRYNKKY
jgi:hypothetical protein